MAFLGAIASSGSAFSATEESYAHVALVRIRLWSGFREQTTDGETFVGMVVLRMHVLLNGGKLGVPMTNVSSDVVELSRTDLNDRINAFPAGENEQNVI